MTDSQHRPEAPLSDLPAEEKARRAGSFGGQAAQYERYRPGPPAAAVDWIVPARVARVVDLGAGTGALTRMLTDRADEVVAVEPDDRMRAVLAERVPGAKAVAGRGESIPLPDRSVDAVLASSSWHWMDPVATLREVGRILTPAGVLGVVWSGPDPHGAFATQARALLARPSPGARPSTPDAQDANGEANTDLGLLMSEVDRPPPRLEIPPGAPFDEPDHQLFTWDVALNADELIGLLGTLSWIITLPDDTRERVLAEARRLLRKVVGVEGDATVDVAFAADAWRTRPSRV